MLTPFPGPNRHRALEHSWDFSKLPNAQEVTFGFRADSREGGLPWIPAALSTFRAATFPRLSVIRLDFRSSASQPVETMIATMGNDLQRIAGEVARIEHEFKGAVNFTVLRDPGPGFGAVLDALNVRSPFVGWR